jgi:hypothetical protein
VANRRSRWRWIVPLVLVALVVAGWIVYGGGRHQGPGVVTEVAVPPAEFGARLAAEETARAELAVGARRGRMILFGDLHVHTTFSADAFLRSLPLVGGTGAHPPADACDYARYCSSLDFFALTDHAESLTPRHWRESVASVRQCNAVAGAGDDPDLVAFMGFEWSQVGLTRETHFGHKNVVFRGLSDEALPARPIGALGPLGQAMANPGVSLLTQLTIPLRDFENRDRYMDFFVYERALRGVDECPAGVDTRELPADCREIATTPAELFEKLDQWGVESLVIPHGTTWGFYTPPGYTWDRQLAPEESDPARQSLIEIYSGHGNSEEYRTWRAAEEDADGQAVCPEPSPDYEPCCWRAGELVRARCPDPDSADCARRVEEARRLYVDAGVAGHLTVPGATVADWRDCGQCRDCFLPAFAYRPGGAVQYILARGSFAAGRAPLHSRFGFLASSDNHTARPGTGYKEVGRMETTEAAGPSSPPWREIVLGRPDDPTPEPRPFTMAQPGEVAPFRILDLERQSSFFLTGGLVAVHSAGRGRDAIWEALERREVYGTSGPRILLWFDLVGEDGERWPMGSEVTRSGAPRFEVRAAGSFVQRPGCPDWVGDALGTGRLAELCLGECYHPSDDRHAITRLEIVRILPQQQEDEPVETLIADPWRVVACDGGTGGCVATVTDDELPALGRDALYYVRAVQEPTPAINAAGLRCQDPACSEVDPCYGDYRTRRDDDCLAPAEERAWSSPIWIDWQPPAPAEGPPPAPPEAEEGPP